MTRRTKIIAGVLGGAAAVILVAAVLAVMLFPAERVRLLAEKEASKALNLPVKIGSFGLTFFGAPSLRAGDVTVGSPRADESALATVKAFSVRVAFLPLLMERRIDILSVTVDTPVVTVITRRGGVSNLPPSGATGARKTGPPMLPIPVNLRSFTVKNGAVRLVDEVKGTETALLGISQRLTLRIGSTVESGGEIAVREVVLIERGRRLPVSGISLGFSHEVTGNPMAGDFVLTKGRLLVNGLPVTIGGAVKGWRTGTFRIDTGDVGAAALVAAAPDSLLPMKSDVTASGTARFAVDLSLDLSGPKPKASWTGECAIRDVSATVKGFPRRIDSLRGTVGITETVLSIRDTEIRIGGSRAAVEGTVAGYLGKPVAAVRVNGSVSLDEAVQAIPGLAKSGIAGGLDFDITAKGPLRPDSLLLDGRADLRKLQVNVPKVLHHPAEMTGSIRITPMAVEFPAFTVKTGKSDFTLSGRLADYRNLLPTGKGAPARLTGALTSKLMDIADMVVIDPNIPFPKPWDLEEPLKNLPIPPTLSAELKIGLGKMTFGRLAADSTRGTATLAKGVFDMPGLAVHAYRGIIAGKMRIDASNPDLISYRGEFEVRKLDAGAFITSFFGAGDNFQGGLSGTLSFSGAGLDSVSFCKNLKGAGTVLFENGRFVNWEFTKSLGKSLKFLNFDSLDFESVRAAFTIADQRIITPAVAVKSAWGDLSLSGSTGFDTSLSYDIAFKLNAKAAELAGKNRLGDLADLIGGSKEPELYLTASGTLKKPSFAIDRARTAKAVGEKLKSEAQKFLDKQGGNLQKKGTKLLEKLFK